MTRFEDDLRALLHSPVGQADADVFLRQVHAAAGRRRRRHRTVGTVVVTVAVAGVAAVALLPGQPQSAPDYVAAPSPSASAATDSSPSDPPTPSTGTSHPTSDVDVVSVSAVSPTEWWAMSTGPCQGSSARCAELQGSILEEPVPLPVPSVAQDPGSQTPETVSQVRFAPDRVDGWVFGGALWATHDGGASWTPAELPPGTEVRSVTTVGDTTALALADTPDGVALFSSPQVHDEWQALPMPFRLGAVRSSLAVTPRMWAFVASTAGGADVVVHSRDAGRHWQQTESPCGAVDSAVAAGQSLWLTCQDAGGAVRKSSDGAHWTPVAKVDMGRGAQLAPVSDLVTLLYHGGEAALVSAAGPQDVRLPLRQGETVRQAEFTGPTTGFLVTSQGRALRSDDGGRTWSLLG